MTQSVFPLLLALRVAIHLISETTSYRVCLGITSPSFCGPQKKKKKKKHLLFDG